WVREFGLGRRWVFLSGAAGLATVLLFVVGGGEALPVPALNIGLLLWGAYLLAEVLATLLPQRFRALRGPLMAAILLLAGGVDDRAVLQTARAGLFAQSELPGGRAGVRAEPDLPANTPTARRGRLVEQPGHLALSGAAISPGSRGIRARCPATASGTGQRRA